MRVLLDAMMPAQLGKFLVGHPVEHAAAIGWQDLSNGKLLNAAEAAGFGVLITKDANMPYQQNMGGRSISLIVVRPGDQSRPSLLALVPRVVEELQQIRPGSVVLIVG